MGVKSVIAVDVDQTQFDSFNQKFKGYQQALSQTPGAWAAVGKENKSLAAGFKVMTAALLAQAELTHKTAAETKKIADSSEKAANYWKGMVGSTKSVMSNVGKIKEGVESVFKVAGFGFIFAGLSSLGSLFGFEKLASFANMQRRSSTGLGVSAGQQNAFNLTFGRYVDTGTLLHGVSTAKGDISSPESIALMKMGILPNSQKNAADTALEVLKRARDLSNKYQGNEQLLGTMGNARGFGQFGIGIEEFRRLRGMSDDDLKQYRDRTKTLGISDKSLKNMQDFDIALSEFTLKIKTVFTDSLSSLATPLKRFTDGLGTAIQKVIGSQGFKDGIEWVSKGLNKFADWMDSPNFKNDLAQFATSAKHLAEATYQVLTGFAAMFKWLNKMGFITSNDATRPDIWASRKILEWLGLAPKGGGASGGGGAGGSVGTGAGAAGASLGGSSGGGVGSVTVMAQGQGGEDSVLKQIAGLENSPDRNGVPQVSPAGAIGKYQIMPDTARQYGYDPKDLLDPKKNEEIARKIVHDLMTRYHGNLAQVLTAYNAGPGVADFLRDNGYLPTTWHGKPWNYRETQKYLERAGIHVNVGIENNTGGSAVASATAMGAGSR